jgi:flagellar motor protein MotB
MSSKLVVILPVALLALASVGCQGTWVTHEQYSRDIAQLREFNEALQRDNAEYRTKAAAYDRLKDEAKIYDDANKTYSELAEALKKALAGLDVEPGEIVVEKDGRVTFATDVLFDFRSWTLTARGKEILGKFAPTIKNTVVKIVGHTDRKPIVSPGMKKELETDTNKELSVKRALAVMAELMKHGLRESQFASIEGHGSDEPRKTDKESRRVEIFVVGGSVAPAAPAKTGFKK